MFLAKPVYNMTLWKLPPPGPSTSHKMIGMKTSFLDKGRKEIWRYGQRCEERGEKVSQCSVPSLLHPEITFDSLKEDLQAETKEAWAKKLCDTWHPSSSALEFRWQEQHRVRETGTSAMKFCYSEAQYSLCKGCSAWRGTGGHWSTVFCSL